MWRCFQLAAAPLALAPRFAEAGITVIDNSSAWRMDPAKKLVVPEINADALTKEDKIIANPNCSTIQMVVALNPLHKKYNIKRIVVSTYQSVTGTGVKAVEQLDGERKKSHQWRKWCLSHGIQVPHRSECDSPDRCFPGQWLYQGRNENGKRNKKDHAG